MMLALTLVFRFLLLLFGDEILKNKTLSFSLAASLLRMLLFLLLSVGLMLCFCELLPSDETV